MSNNFTNFRLFSVFMIIYLDIWMYWLVHHKNIYYPFTLPPPSPKYVFVAYFLQLPKWINKNLLLSILIAASSVNRSLLITKLHPRTTHSNIFTFMLKRLKLQQIEKVKPPPHCTRQLSREGGKRPRLATLPDPSGTIYSRNLREYKRKTQDSRPATQMKRYFSGNPQVYAGGADPISVLRGAGSAPPPHRIDRPSRARKGTTDPRKLPGVSPRSDGGARFKWWAAVRRLLFCFPANDTVRPGVGRQRRNCGFRPPQIRIGDGGFLKFKRTCFKTVSIFENWTYPTNFGSLGQSKLYFLEDHKKVLTYSNLSAYIGFILEQS